MKKITSAAIVVFCFSIFMVGAQPGSLDNTFGTAGKALTPIGSGYDMAQGMAVQTDGKIVVVGNSNNGTDNDFAVARYTSNGVLDATFGTGGIVTTAIGASHDNGKAVAIQADGKIVVVGISYNGVNNDIALARYNTNGTLDNTFSSFGFLTTSVLGYDCAGYSVALVSGNKIVVGGYATNGTDYDFVALRYSSAGSLDATFGTAGIAIVPIASADDYCYAMAVQADGKIVLAGTVYQGTQQDFGLARLNANGTLDNTFGSSGVLTTLFGTDNDIAWGVAIQSDGKIVAAGSMFNGTNNDFAMARYTATGALDNTFGISGKVTTAVGAGADVAYAVGIQADQKIVLAGYSGNGTNYDFALARYTSAGTIDAGFGTSGTTVTAMGTSDEIAYAMAFQNGSKILVAGYYNSTVPDWDFAVARYNGCAPVTFSQDTSIFQGDTLLVGSHMHSTVGTFIDTLTASSGCDSVVTSILHVVIPTVHEIENSLSLLNISPNPSTGIFNVGYTTSGTEPVIVEVYNILGEKIHTSRMATNSLLRIDLLDYPRGIYTVKVIDGDSVSKGKIVLQ